jgi:photosystem II stability/assembly factor-like uncharacterized protein
VYIGPADYGLHGSSDGGSTWDYLGLNGVSISAILASSEVEAAIFVGTDDNNGVYVSWDRGQTWENPGVLRDSVISMIEDPSEPGVVLVTTRRNGLLRTRDGGRSWVGLGLERPTFGRDIRIASLVATPNDPDHVYAIPGYGPGLFESEDGGASWSPVVGLPDLMGVDLAAAVVNPDSPTDIYASGFGGAVFHSENGGKSWRLITQNLPRGGHAPIAVSDDGTLFAGPSDRGVWVRATHTDEWTRTGLGTATVERLWVSPEGNRIFALDSQGVLHTSIDRGLTWRSALHRFSALEVDPFSGKSLIGVTDSLDILSSEDSGSSWEAVGRATSCESQAIRIVAGQDQRGVYYLSCGLTAALTTDRGRNWEYLSLPVSGTPCFASESRLYLAHGLELYVSEDLGRRWSQVRCAEVVSSFTGFGRIGQDIELAGTPYDGIFVSRNNGKSWKQTSIGSGHRVLELWMNDGLESSQAIALIDSTFR